MSPALGARPDPSFTTLYCRPLVVVLTPGFLALSARNAEPAAAAFCAAAAWDLARWSLICCYNARNNDPFLTHGRHPNYSPLEIWEDDRVSQILTGKLD